MDDGTSEEPSPQPEEPEEPSPQPKPWPKLEVLGGLLGGDFTKTRSLSIDDEGIIHALGYKVAKTIITDTNTDTSVFVDSDHHGFVGSIEASNGFTYHIPAYAKMFGRLDRSTGVQDFIHEFAYTPQVRCGAEGANGILYMSRYTKSGGIRSYNPNTDVWGSVPFERDPERTSWFNGHWGAASDKDNNVYMPPWMGTTTTKIDTNGIPRQLGGSPLMSGLVGAASQKYNGMVYDIGTHQMFSTPRAGNKILVINCSDDTQQEIPLPQALIDKFGSAQKSFSCYLGPDGYVYSTAWGAPIIFRINVVTLEVEWKDYTEEFKLTEWRANGTGITTHAIVRGNNAYLGLGGGMYSSKLVY